MGGYLESRQLGQERSSPYTIVGALKIQEGECGSSGLRAFKRVEDSLGDASYLVRGGVTFSEAGLVRSEETARLKPELKAGLNEPLEVVRLCNRQRRAGPPLWIGRGGIRTVVDI